MFRFTPSPLIANAAVPVDSHLKDTHLKFCSIFRLFHDLS
jgi:hypothetical protein